MKSDSNKVFDFVNHGLEIDKLIRSSFNDSQMSNAKWKKLFVLLAEQFPQVYAIWKFVGANNDGVALLGSPKTGELEETYINHRFWLGPRYYKEIQWITFPRVIRKSGYEKVPSRNSSQDTDLILSELKKVGYWPVAETNDGFTIFGHRFTPRT
ncbi:hypothetical protein [Arsukibacterium sp.]|uniref:hypothetical protein n=1 Tax=Arsukibacterium sp. TaxID=1977258 RepID=UPI001BD47921|nr:hypothetical protein [Arsukibacterium sp.]